LAGLMIVFLLSALDQTVVSTAMPRIIAELNGLTLYAWVTTAYLLTSTVMVPIWGKLGDIYGRKPVLLAGIGIFLAGSWLSGLSGEFGPVLGVSGMVQLIVFRALQGSAAAPCSPPPSRSSPTSIRRASGASSPASSARCSAWPACWAR
jgi:MFS family permease